MFTLTKLSYHACNEAERIFYDDLATPDMDLKTCCTDVLSFIKSSTNGEVRSTIEEPAFSGDMGRAIFADGQGFRSSTVEVRDQVNTSLQHAPKQGSQWTEMTCENAARNGHMECLAYAHSNGCPWDALVCAAAAKNNQLECLAYAHAHGCPVDETICENAAAAGHVDVLRYARENGIPWDGETIREAARCGQLECLQYAHENGCPLDAATCEDAAMGGNVECLRYAFENGFPFDSVTCESAANRGHFDCLRFAHENGCPWDERTCDAAAFHGHANCMEYALANGCPWQATMYDPAIDGDIAGWSAGGRGTGFWWDGDCADEWSVLDADDGGDDWDRAAYGKDACCVRAADADFARDGRRQGAFTTDAIENFYFTCDW